MEYSQRRVLFQQEPYNSKHHLDGPVVFGIQNLDHRDSYGLRFHPEKEANIFTVMVLVHTSTCAFSPSPRIVIVLIPAISL